MSPGVMEGFLPPAEVGDAIGDAAFAVNCAAILSASGRRRCGGHDRTRFIRAVLPAKLARWGLMLTGALAWFLYSYATMAVGAAFNQLFLVYVAPFSASLWAFMIAIRDIDITRLARELSRLPRRGPAVLMLASGAATAAIWLGPILAAQLVGDQPPRLAGYTTAVTTAIDVAVIAPAAFAASLLILRRSPSGTSWRSRCSSWRRCSRR